MGLFGGYERAGAGIAKDAPQKKPFFRYWELVFRKFWKLIDVNMLLMASLLPLIAAVLVVYYLTDTNPGLALLLALAFVVLGAVLFGPTVAGCTQVLRNFAKEKPCFLLETFWKAFRENFRKASAVGIIDILVGVSVLSGFKVYPELVASTGSGIYYVLFVLSLSIAITVAMMSFYAYLMIVSTDLKLGAVLKNSLALSFIALKKNFLTLVLAVLVMGGFGILTFLFPYILTILWVFLPTGFVAFMIVFNCYPVIQKYVINPYYAQRGEVSPEMTYSRTDGENLFEDRGGKEAPVEPPKKKGRKGKVIS